MKGIHKFLILFIAFLTVGKGMAQGEKPHLIFESVEKNHGLVTVGGVVFTTIVADQIRREIKKNKEKKEALEKEIVTLYDGKYDEIHIKERYRKVGKVLVDMETEKIVGFAVEDSLDFQPEVLSRFPSIDPAANEYPGISPYAFVNNNPIRYIDPDGQRFVDANKNEFTITITDGNVTFAYKDPNLGEVPTKVQEAWTPIVEALGKSGTGNVLLEVMHTSEVEFLPIKTSKLGNGAASRIIDPEKTDVEAFESGYDQAQITLNLSFLERNSRRFGVDLEEYISATILVEYVHTLPEQRKLDLLYNNKDKFKQYANVSDMQLALRIDYRATNQGENADYNDLFDYFTGDKSTELFKTLRKMYYQETQETNEEKE